MTQDKEKTFNERFDEKFDSSQDGRAMPSGTETARKIKQFFRKEILQVINEFETTEDDKILSAEFLRRKINKKVAELRKRYE